MTDLTPAFRSLAPDESGVAIAAAVVEVGEMAVRDNGSVVLRLQAADWPELQLAAGADLLVELGGVRDFRLQKDQPGEKIMQVQTDGPLCWDCRSSCSIMGNAPLPDPHRFFVEFTGLLSDLGSPRAAKEYLNWRGSFSAWREIVISRAFLLLTAPLEIAAGATELLDYQAAEYMLLNDPAPPGGDNIFAVSFGRSWVVAESATRL